MNPLDRGADALRERVRARKGLDADLDLSLWGAAELASLTWTLGTRLARGQVVRWRLGRSDGFVLAERNVRVHHPHLVTAGRELSLEEGCEIVGLSRRGVRFGDRCTVGRFATIRPTNVLFDDPGEGLHVGDNSNVGAYSFIGCSGFVSIGADVLMGPRVTILAENHVFDATDSTIKGQGVTRSFVSIADDCWIGAGSTILAGVSVGPGSVIGAGAVVVRDIPAGSVAVGVPARVVGTREGHGVRGPSAE